MFYVLLRMVDPLMLRKPNNGSRPSRLRSRLFEMRLPMYSSLSI